MEITAAVTSQRHRDISRTLVAERRRAGSLRGFPGELPANLGEAYRVQALSRIEWPDKVVGWKVGGIPAKHREALGADYLSGPIFARRFFRAKSGVVNPMPVFADGFAAIEPEFVLQIGETADQDRVFVGAEIASSPIVAINDIGPLAVVCDFGNNNGLLLGPEIANWRELGGECVPVRTEIEGETVGEKDVFDLPEAVNRSRAFLIDLAQREGIDLPAGTYISTGAITGVHDAVCGNRSTLHFGERGTLEIELVAEQPLL